MNSHNQLDWKPCLHKYTYKPHSDLNLHIFIQTIGALLFTSTATPNQRNDLQSSKKKLIELETNSWRMVRFKKRYFVVELERAERVSRWNTFYLVNHFYLLLKNRGKFDLDLKPLDSRDCDLAEAVKDKVVFTSFKRNSWNHMFWLGSNSYYVQCTYPPRWFEWYRNILI